MGGRGGRRAAGVGVREPYGTKLLVGGARPSGRGVAFGSSSRLAGSGVASSVMTPSREVPTAATIRKHGQLNCVIQTPIFIHPYLAVSRLEEEVK